MSGSRREQFLALWDAGPHEPLDARREEALKRVYQWLTDQGKTDRGAPGLSELHGKYQTFLHGQGSASQGVDLDGLPLIATRRTSSWG